MGVGTMAKKPKSAKDPFKVEQKRSGRWSVIGPNGKYVNGADKVAVLTQKGLVKAPTKKAAPAENA
jgi:hypothetical protein